MYLVTLGAPETRPRFAEEPRVGHIEFERRVGEGRARHHRGQRGEAEHGGLPEEGPALEGSRGETAERGVAVLEQLHAGLEASGDALVGSPDGPRPRVHSTHETPLATQVTRYFAHWQLARDVANPSTRGLTVVGQEGFEPP